MTTATVNAREVIEKAIKATTYDPYKFVMFSYPWGEAGTPLEHEDGPDAWQADILEQIRLHFEKGGDLAGALQIAVRSGHGIGKTALIAWLIHWFIETRKHPQIVVTANTSAQLNSKTWRELAKWHKMSINKEQFVWTATKFYHVEHPETWFATALPWSEHKSEAFAGTHEENVLMIFDEASLIPKAIWEVAEGAMTGPNALWIAFGNPTRNTGRFSECFKKYRHRWITREIDSRTTKMADKTKINQWIEDYGEDSDFVRVRVKGQEPRAGDMQFIGTDVATLAYNRSVTKDDVIHATRVIGVDPSRTGDRTVIFKRQGHAAFSPIVMTPKTQSKLKTEDIASRVVHEIREFDPDAVFIDVGYNPGVYDLIVSMGYDNIFSVNFGGSATDDKYYANKRAEMWGRMKDWIETGSIPEDGELLEEITTPLFGYSATGKLIIEKKEDLREPDRLGRSPDKADALALTFAEFIAPRVTEDNLELAMQRMNRVRVKDPFENI